MRLQHRQYFMGSRSATSRAVSRVVVVLVSLGLTGVAGGMAGCGGVDPVASYAGPVTDPTLLYTSLTVDHPAITMSTVAPYDALQLTATPRDALGNPMTGLPAPMYLSSDTTKVRVSADGMVTAVGTVIGVRVIATLVAGPVSHVDTALIDVTNTATPPKLASLSIQPVAPDSAVWPLFGKFDLAYVIAAISGLQKGTTLVPRLVDSAGNPMSVGEMAYTSLDLAIGSADRLGNMNFRKPGQVRIVAQTTAYGISRADTLTATVIMPVAQAAQIYARADGTPGFFTVLPDNSLAEMKDIYLAPSGIVAWYNYTPHDIDIVFDDPTNVVQPTVNISNIVVGGFGGQCAAGNTMIPANLDPDPEWGVYSTIRVVQFPVPGVYTYRSTAIGTSMRVIVNKDLPPE